MPPEVVELRIDFDGALWWNETVVDRAPLLRDISAETMKSPQPEVHILVDRLARYEIVAQTLADLQGRRLRKVAFVKND